MSSEGDGRPADSLLLDSHLSGRGDWSVGAAERAASMVVVHAIAPLPPFYDPAFDGFTGEGIDDLGSFVGGALIRFLSRSLPPPSRTAAATPPPHTLFMNIRATALYQKQ